MKEVAPTLGYLSGAPRVSTRAEAEASGPRAHVLGVMDGFRGNGWNVEPYIVGDRLPLSWIRGSEQKLVASGVRRAAADLVRIALCEWHLRQALASLGGRCDWVYERFGVFQMLGRGFQRRGIPWIVESNALHFLEAATERSSIALQGLARRQEIWVYRQADVVVTVTQALKDIVVEVAGVPPEKVMVVPNGVDTSRFSPAVAAAPRPFQGGTIGFVGSFIGWQALDLLIRAIADLDAEGIVWNAVLVGDGPMLAEWRQLARELGLQERISFPGRIPWSEVPSCVAGFDLCYSGQIPLQIGTMYHSPLKLYEYMAIGKPVLASAFEDTCRLVRPGETGFLFQGGDLRSLKSALRSAWEARGQWETMGGRARQLIVREHSWESRVSEMIPRIRSILALGELACKR